MAVNSAILNNLLNYLYIRQFNGVDDRYYCSFVRPLWARKWAVVNKDGLQDHGPALNSARSRQIEHRSRASQRAWLRRKTATAR